MSDDILEKVNKLYNTNTDVKELMHYYNFYSKEIDGFSFTNPAWRETCVNRIKEELHKRGIISSATLSKLEAQPDFMPAPGLVIRVNVEANEFEFLKDEYSLEEDLNNSIEIKDLVKNDDIAVKLYGALCNVDWYKDGIRWACSWRYAGGLVADLRDKNEDYMDFYCSGNEGVVDPLIEENIKKFGWTPKTS